jgi:hypothetical protein
MSTTGGGTGDTTVCSLSDIILQIGYIDHIGAIHTTGMVGDIIHIIHIIRLGMDSIRIMHTVAGEVIGVTIMDGMVLRLIIRVFIPVDILTIMVVLSQVEIR